MARINMEFGLIKVSLEDDRTTLTEITNLAYNTIVALIPEAKSAQKEERAHSMEFQLKQMKMMKNSGCGECDEDDCSEDSDSNHPNSKGNVEKKISNLYV